MLIALHLAGMWLTFAASAWVIGGPLARLALTLRRREQEIARLRGQIEARQRAGSASGPAVRPPRRDGAVEIPQLGTKHSLNVSVTAGMVIWEFAKRLML